MKSHLCFLSHRNLKTYTAMTKSKINLLQDNVARLESSDPNRYKFSPGDLKVYSPGLLGDRPADLINVLNFLHW